MAKKKPAPSRTRTSARTRSAVSERAGLEPEGYKTEIKAICFFALGISVGIAIFSGSNGIVIDYLNRSLIWLLGSGRFLLPVMLVMFSFLILFRKNRDHETRIAAGLTFFTLAFVTAVHISAPQGEGLLDPLVLENYGGMVGSFLSYVLVSLFGKTIAYIFTSVMFVVSLIVTFKFSALELVERIREGVEEEEEQLDLRRGRAGRAQGTRDSEFAETVVLPRKRATIKNLGETMSAHVATATDLIGRNSSKEKAREEIDGYKLPPLELLALSGQKTGGISEKEINASIETIEKTLSGFNIEAVVNKVNTGPTVTRYEIQVDSTVKLNKIASLESNLALALASHDVHIIAPIPGKSAVGIDVPNKKREIVTLGDVLRNKGREADKFMEVLIGMDISGKAVFHDLREMPHLLVAGTTGSGKSIYVSALLTSLIMNSTPSELKMIMIDMKKVELSMFSDIPHLLTPVVIDSRSVISVLNWTVREMEQRYEKLRLVGVKNIKSHNQHFTREKQPENIMPYIVVVIDELADLFMTVRNDAEHAICRLAQLARAVGIHLIVATQRPSIDVVTGVIKANFPSRVAFAVSSNTDSRVILDTPGAERLSGKGDMLFMTTGTSKPVRLQGAYVGETEIQNITAFVKRQAKPHYESSIFDEIVGQESNTVDMQDDLYEAAREVVVEAKMASASLLQRKLKVGYARAARLIDMLDSRGIVGPYDGSRPRAVLMTREELDELKSGKVG